MLRSSFLWTNSARSSRRISYDCGLLPTLRKRRNRLNTGKESKEDRENAAVLHASQDASREVSSGAVGYGHCASARAYRAGLNKSGRSRCTDLHQASVMLKRAPAPLREETERINSLVQREQRGNGCSRVTRR